MRRVALTFLLMLFFGGAALAERRVALVFGADDYEMLRPLDNAVNDARSIERALEALGFDVSLETDRDLRRMRRALDDFREDGAGADVALVFFAGHGAEISGENRLLPVDADASSLDALKGSTLRLEEITETVRAVAPVALVLLDACRNDPFGATSGDGRGAKAIAAASPEVVAGLGRVGRAENVLFAFAAAPGKTASDGANGNSPFTAALAAHLGAEGVQVGSALKLVQQDVYDRTRGDQLPFIEDGLPQMFFAAANGGAVPERERLLLAMADISFEVRDEVEAVASARDMPLAPLYAALISSDSAGLSSAERGRRLEEAAGQYLKVREELRSLGAADPQVAALRSDAEQQLALGALDTARSRLAEAAAVDAASRSALKANYYERTLSEAATHYLSGRVARAELSHDAAVGDFEKALALYAEVPIDVTPDADLRRRMQALDGLGDTWQVLGNLAKAEIAFGMLRDVGATRAAADPANLGKQRDLAVAHHRIGDLDIAQGELSDALAAHQAGFAGTAAIAASDPGQPGAQRDVAVSHEKVGDVRMQQGDLAGALADYRQALAIMERLLAADPGNADLKRSVGIDRDKVAHVLAAQGKLSEAASGFEQALADFERLLAADPDNVRVQSNYAALQDRIGDARRAEGKLAAARAAYEASLAVRERLARADPANTARQRDLSISYERMGDIARAENDLASALLFYEKLLAIRQRLAKSDGGNAEWQADLAIAFDRVGDTSAARGEPDRAAQALEASLAIRQRLAEADPESRARHGSLAISHEKLGNLRAGRRDFAAALASYRAALTIQEGLAADARANGGLQRDLSVYIERVADMQAQQGDLQAAHAGYARALAIREQLTAGEPGNADWQRDVIIAQVKLAALGDTPVTRYERALEIAVNLRDSGRLAPADVWMVEALQAMVDQAGQAKAQ